jgi:hypothetical protein
MQDNQDIPEPKDPTGEKKEALPPEIPVVDTPRPAPDPETTIDLTHTAAAHMDVHHQPHIHHKKRWKDYIFEFFMLFLAVSASFLVENLREHYVEHQRAKEYAAMLRKDLASDTVIINIIVAFRNEQAKRYDSLRGIMDSVPFEKINQRQFLLLAAQAGKYLHLLPNNGTLQQLKSSGALRYFKDTALVYTLTSYEEDLKHGEYVQSEEKDYYTNQVIPFKLTHFNSKLAEPGIPAARNYPNEMMIDFDKKAMMQFSNLLERSVSFNRLLGEESFSRHKKKATALIKMLDEEYRLN